MSTYNPTTSKLYKEVYGKRHNPANEKRQAQRIARKAAEAQQFRKQKEERIKSISTEAAVTIFHLMSVMSEEDIAHVIEKAIRNAIS
jgi:hypothetical protein